MKFNKKFMIPIVSLVVIGMVFAIVIPYFGSVERTAIVDSSMSFTGNNAATANVNGGETVISEDLLVESQTSVNVPLDIDTILSPNDAGITNTINYLLDNLAGTCTPYPSATCEKRIYVNATDVSITTLSDLSTISWAADVGVGYLPHVDIKLANGESLVFEYAKVDATNCDATPYPTGVLNTFGTLGTISDSSYAWLSSGPAGPCGDATFDANHKTLTDWKATWGTIEVIGFEFEIDNWISASNSTMKNILINGNDVEVTVQPDDSLAFNVETVFPLNVVDTYTITTNSEPRI